MTKKEFLKHIEECDEINKLKAFIKTLVAYNAIIGPSGEAEDAVSLWGDSGGKQCDSTLMEVFNNY